MPEGLAVFALPEPHGRRLRTASALERLDRELHRRTRVATVPQRGSAPPSRLDDGRYAADGELRERDDDYREMPPSELRKLISLRDRGLLEESERVSFLGARGRRPAGPEEA